jgi:O-antigen biosynthesis protein
MKTSIIILSFNNFASTTGMCLQMLASDSDFLSWEVIVVDNASDAATQSGLSDAKQLYPHVQFVFNPSNLGFSAGNNVGIRLAKGDVLVLLNSDAFPPPGMIGRMVEHFNDDAPWGLLAPVTNSAGNEQAIFTASDSMEGKIIEGVKYAQQCHSRPINAYRLDFCCVAIPRLVADKVGLLDEDFGRGYYEDFDYSLRVKQAGYQLGVTEDAFVYHRGSTSFGKVSKETKALIKRNKQRIFSKYGRSVVMQHMRLANLSVLEQYYARKISGDIVSECRIANRLHYARSILPKSWFKRWRYMRKLSKVEQCLLIPETNQS